MFHCNGVVHDSIKDLISLLFIFIFIFHFFFYMFQVINLPFFVAQKLAPKVNDKDISTFKVKDFTNDYLMKTGHLMLDI